MPHPQNTLEDMVKTSLELLQCVEKEVMKDPRGRTIIEKAIVTYQYVLNHIILSEHSSTLYNTINSNVETK